MDIIILCFLLFFCNNFLQLLQRSGVDPNSVIGQLWRSASPTTKRPYKEMAAEDKKRCQKVSQKNAVLQCYYYYYSFKYGYYYNVHIVKCLYV